MFHRRSSGGGGVDATASPTRPSPTQAKLQPSSSSSSIQQPKSPSRLTQDAMLILRQMLLYLDPAAAHQLPIDAPLDTPTPVPISGWTTMYSGIAASITSSSSSSSVNPHKATIEVLASPTEPGLFCVRSVVPDVSARQFWTLMAESGNRHKWDWSVQEGGNWRWLAEELSQQQGQEKEAELARSISARMEYLRFSSVFPVAKARDMVLLSADVQLPPTATSPLRMISACRSEVDAGKPPLKGYSRYTLGVGGFMVEELGDDGLIEGRGGFKAIRGYQLSSLGDLVSYVPNSVVRMVAQKLVPKSIALITKAAQSIIIPRTLTLQEAPSGVAMKDEEFTPGGERWSKARVLPGRIGVGILARPSIVEEPLPLKKGSLNTETVVNIISSSSSESSLAS